MSEAAPDDGYDVSIINDPTTSHVRLRRAQRTAAVLLTTWRSRFPDGGQDDTVVKKEYDLDQEHLAVDSPTGGTARVVHTRSSGEVVAYDFTHDTEGGSLEVTSDRDVDLPPSGVHAYAQFARLLFEVDRKEVRG